MQTPTDIFRPIILDKLYEEDAINVNNNNNLNNTNSVTPIRRVLKVKET